MTVILVVDELRKSIDESLNPSSISVIVSTLMKQLCLIYDRNPRLYLSFAAYGAKDVETFMTASNRRIYLQPLPPIFPVTDLADGRIPVLPPVLQVFAREDLRHRLPGDPSQQAVYAKLSRVLLKSGGHPRSVQHLLATLREEFPDNKYRGPERQ